MSYYQIAKATQQRLRDDVEKASEALREFTPNDGTLTPDSVRAKPEFQTAKADYDKAFKTLQNYNAFFTHLYRAEEKQARAAKRNSPTD